MASAASTSEMRGGNDGATQILSAGGSGGNRSDARRNKPRICRPIVGGATPGGDLQSQSPPPGQLERGRAEPPQQQQRRVVRDRTDGLSMQCDAGQPRRLG